MKNSRLYLLLFLAVFAGCPRSYGQDNPSGGPVTVIPNGKGDRAYQRQWFVTGEDVPAMASLDEIFQTFMKTNSVRAGQMTVLKDGVVKYSRAFTWAEPSYRIIQPSDPFRLASCSKIFLEEAVQSLYDAGKLSPDTKVYPFLGFSGPLDPQSDTITVQQLLDHLGGYDRKEEKFDPVFNMRKIANVLGLHHAISKEDIATYMYKYTQLDHPPGAQFAYSNYGYLLAGMVVEQVSGLKFMDYVNQNVLQPTGLAPLHITATAQISQVVDEPSYEDTSDGLSADPSSDTVFPMPYGGNGMLFEVADSAAGIACSATELAQVIHLYKVWGNGTRDQLEIKRGHYKNRSGSMQGTSCWAESRWDGIDWVCVFNTRDFLYKDELTQPSTGRVTLPVQVDRILNAMGL
jgi:CubicO group peptidase (beta-lactamase class C family)